MTESKFDFDLIVPKPKVLENVESMLTKKNKNLGLTCNDSKTFPNKCWYEWCIHNWGTKWNTNPKWSSCTIERTIIPDDPISKIKYKDIVKLIYSFQFLLQS